MVASCEASVKKQRFWDPIFLAPLGEVEEEKHGGPFLGHTFCVAHGGVVAVAHGAVAVDVAHGGIVAVAHGAVAVDAAHGGVVAVAQVLTACQWGGAQEGGAQE